MEIKTIEDCFKLRLLRKINPSKEKSIRSLELSKCQLKEAGYLFEKDFFRYVVVSSYMAMFHAARAVLYSDGIQEKNHFAIYIYLKENYSKIIPINIINIINIYRIERHEAVYGLGYEANKEEAEISIKDAESFVDAMESILKKK